MPHTIGVIGTGYVGLVSGTCFAEVGNTVICVDVDHDKVLRLRQAKSPIYEPGLELLLERNVRDGRLIFTTELADAVRECTALFLCLPTPPNEDGSADLNYVLQVTRHIAEHIISYGITDTRIIITRSTVPVGTAEKVRAVLNEVAPHNDIRVASNPEFLREGFAVEDTMRPDRVVVGTNDEYVKEFLCDVYEPFVVNGNPIFVMDEKSAEVTKYAANAFLAMKISFMNDLSRYCEVSSVDIENVRLGIGSDSRIGKRFIYPGIGYGGSCFPKDVKALIHSTRSAGTPLKIIEAVEEVNKEQIARFIQKIVQRFDGNLQGKRLALWGLSFKPNTDDVREAPAFEIIRSLITLGASVSVYDPEAIANTKAIFGDVLHYVTSMYNALESATALIIATEWKEFLKPDFNLLKKSLDLPLIFDGRNIYEPKEMQHLGFEYHCIGRPFIPLT